MKAKQLTAFSTVMQTGSMSEAARLLDISQPAVSRLIRDLESELEFSLFDRRNGRVVPTTAASSFHPEVVRYFAGLNGLQQRAEQIRQLKSEQLKIAAVAPFNNQLVPAAQAALCRQYPELFVSVEQLSGEDIVRQVAQYQVDLGITSLPVDLNEVSVLAAYQTDYRVLCHRDSWLAQLPEVMLEDLRREALIRLTARNQLDRHRVDEAFREQLVRPEYSFEVAHAGMAAGLVAENAGVAVLDPFSALALGVGDLVSVPLQQAPKFPFAFVVAEQSRQQELAGRFIDSLLSRIGTRLSLEPIDT